MDGQTDLLPTRLPLSSIENVVTRRAFGIPKLKVSSIARKASPKENVATTTYDALRDLVEEFVHDRTAAVVANKYISELQRENIGLHCRIRALEETLPLSINNHAELPVSTSTHKITVRSNKKLVSEQQVDKILISSTNENDIACIGLTKSRSFAVLNSSSCETVPVHSEYVKPQIKSAAEVDNFTSKFDTLDDTLSKGIPIVRRSARRISLSASSGLVISKKIETTKEKKCRHQNDAYDKDHSDTGTFHHKFDGCSALPLEYKKESAKTTSSASNICSQNLQNDFLSTKLSRTSMSSDISGFPLSISSSLHSSQTMNINENNDVLPHNELYSLSESGDGIEFTSRIRTLSISHNDNTVLMPNPIGSHNNITETNNSNSYSTSTVGHGDEENYGLLMFDSVPVKCCSSQDLNSLKGSLSPNSPSDVLCIRASMDATIYADKVGIALDKRKQPKKKSVETLPAGRRMSARFRVRPTRFLSVDVDEEAEAASQGGIRSARKESVPNTSSLPKDTRPGRLKKEAVSVLRPSSRRENLQLPESDAPASYEEEVYDMDTDIDDLNMVMTMDDYPIQMLSSPSAEFRPITTLTPSHTSSQWPEQNQNHDEDNRYYDDGAYEDQAILRWCDEENYSPSDAASFTCTVLDEIGEGSSDQNIHLDKLASYDHVCDTVLSKVTAIGVSDCVNTVAISAVPVTITCTHSQLVGASTRDSSHTDQFNSVLTASSLPMDLRTAFEVIASRQVMSMKQSSPAGTGYITALLCLITAARSTLSLSIPPEFLPTLARSLAALVECMDHPDDQLGRQLNQVGSKSTSTVTSSSCSGGKKSVHFFDVDGSSVITPGKDCAHEPALHTVRRLHLLISRIDDFVAVIFSYGDEPGKQQLLDTVLFCCQHLQSPHAASVVSSALLDSLSLSATSGAISAIAGMLTSELTAAKNAQLISPTPLSLSLVGARTVLRFRTAWMATSVLRAQLRWLLDPPPAHASVPTASGYPVSSIRRCDIYKMVTLRESVCTEAPISKKQRRKSDVIIMDHTVVNPLDMSLSSLLTHALRQIYDAFTTAVAGSSSESTEGPSSDIFVSEFLTAAVTAFDDGEQGGPPSLDGLELTQPQVRCCLL